MTDNPIAMHLRAALEAVAAREEERVRSIFDDADRSTNAQVKGMEPVLRLLSQLKDVVGDRAGVRFVIADSAISASAETGTAASHHRIDITFDPTHEQYRVERTDTFLFADGGSHSSVVRVGGPDEAVRHVVEMMGEHIGSERVMLERSASKRDSVDEEEC